MYNLFNYLLEDQDTYIIKDEAYLIDKFKTEILKIDPIYEHLFYPHSGDHHLPFAFYKTHKEMCRDEYKDSCEWYSCEKYCDTFIVSKDNKVVIVETEQYDFKDHKEYSKEKECVKIYVDRKIVFDKKYDKITLLKDDYMKNVSTFLKKKNQYINLDNVFLIKKSFTQYTW